MIEAIPHLDTDIIPDAIGIGEYQARIVGLGHIKDAAVVVDLIDGILPRPDFTINFLANAIFRDKGAHTVGQGVAFTGRGDFGAGDADEITGKAIGFLDCIGALADFVVVGAVQPVKQLIFIGGVHILTDGPFAVAVDGVRVVVAGIIALAGDGQSLGER